MQCVDTMVKLQANIRKEQLLNSKLGIDFYVHVRAGSCLIEVSLIQGSGGHRLA